MKDWGMVSGVLDAVYEAATSPAGWSDALRKIGNAFDCQSAALIDRNLRSMQGQVTTTGIDAGSQREFLDVWSARDILRQRTKAWRPGAVETDQQILPKPELLASDYYNGFMKPRDMHAVMRLTLAHEDRFLKVISLIRPRSAGEFEASAAETCRWLMPHLQRATSIGFHVDEANATLGAFSDLIDRSANACLILDASGRVKFANQSARAMAEAADGLLLRNDRLEILDGSSGGTLYRLLAGATGQLKEAAARGGVVRLARPSGKSSLTAIVGPLARASNWAGSGPMAFVLITDPDATSIRPEAMLKQLFGFSRAETRVAERLMMGDSPEQAAATLNIKISTARWHLAALYRKTGAKRQAELVRLLLSLPAI